MLGLAVWLQRALELNPLGSLGGELAATTLRGGILLKPIELSKGAQQFIIMKWAYPFHKSLHS